MGRGGRRTLSQVAHRAAHDERSRLLGGAAAFALVAGVAIDDGGFTPLSWDRPLVGLAALVLVVALAAGVERPSRPAAVTVGALAALAAWTAASWLWSASPARAFDEAQRVALYAVAAGAVALNRRRVPLRPAVVGAIVLVACWNLATRLNGVGSSTGAGAEPVGYANALALLCVLGILLWAPAAVVLGPVLVLQQSDGAYAALLAGAAVFALRSGRLRVAATAVAVGVALAAPYAGGGHERTHYWRVAVREAHAHPIVGSGAGTYVNAWVRDRDVALSTQEAHSLYLETLAELGPPGLALVLLALAVPIAVARRREEAAVVAAYAVGAAVDFHWELAGVTLPALLVAAAASSAGPRRREAPLRAVVPAAAVVGAAAFLAYAGNAALAAATAAAQRGDFAAAAREARVAHRRQPWSPQPWVVLGDSATTRAERVAAYTHAVRLDGADWSLWQRLAGAARGRLRRLAEARAAQLNPLARSGS